MATGKSGKRKRKLTDAEKIRVRLLLADGFDVPEICELLDVDRASVASIARLEERHRERARQTLDRLLDQRRSLLLRRAELLEILGKYRELLPLQISRNGHQAKHIELHDKFVDLSVRISRMDEILARVDDQIAKADGTYRELGGDRPSASVVEIPVLGTPELGDLPDEGGGLSGHRDGEGADDDADQ